MSGLAPKPLALPIEERESARAYLVAPLRVLRCGSARPVWSERMPALVSFFVFVHVVGVNGWAIVFASV